ncbi:MAG: glycosyltransferase family 4 protein [Candidatus Methanomethylophilaceae archaeon]|mgnify:FL=1|jgi:glycosyltransferase involved in cell wall biosynthesis|nr:glycosyltransferase family 4 protein [Candidatus Methanomethylophilaceae archaeon]
MKFVDVNPFFFPYKGGIEHRMHDTARLLAERGHDVTILTSRLPGTPEEERTEEGYRILRLKSKYIDVYNPPLVSSKGVLEALISIDPDVANYNYRWAPSYNRDLARYDGKKIFTYHNMWGEGEGWLSGLSEFNDNRFRRVLDTFDHIVCVSGYVRDDLVSRGVPPEMTTVVPSCLSSFPEVSREEGDFILSLGRLVNTKGLKYLVEAMKDVDCRLVICGKGPVEKKLKRQIERLGLEGKIEMKGYVSEEEKAILMSTCRFFAMPSVFESLGLAAIELMSYGRPIVCSDVNGLPETVGDGGVTVPSKDPTALADAMNLLLSDKKKRAEMGVLARSRAEFYDWKNHIGPLEKVLEDVAGGKEVC